jgi:hypothetical protein
MPNSSNLENLVFGEKRPDLKLLEQGIIPSSWFADFEAALDAELRASTGSTWSRNLIQASHWVSFYLPLRVRVASHTVGVSHAISKQVFDLHIKTEQKLLLNLANSIDRNTLESLSSEQSLMLPELEIIRLSLGKGNPIAAHYDSSSIGKWREAFETNWKPVASALQASTQWNKWSIVAVRLASFYWDLFFTQNVALPESFSSDFPGFAIHVVLHPPNAEIDETGLPIIGTRIQTSKLSVRRLIEPIIMAR